MHAALTFQVMRDSRANVLEQLGVDDFTAARQAIISCILSTDMEHHAKLQVRLCLMKGLIS